MILRINPTQCVGTTHNDRVDNMSLQCPPLVRHTQGYSAKVQLCF